MLASIQRACVALLSFQGYTSPNNLPKPCVYTCHMCQATCPMYNSIQCIHPITAMLCVMTPGCQMPLLSCCGSQIGCLLGLQDTAGNVAWANDNKTLLYVTKDKLDRPFKVACYAATVWHTGRILCGCPSKALCTGPHVPRSSHLMCCA